MKRFLTGATGHSVQHEMSGTTLLSGNIPDQPDLYGMLLKLSQIEASLLLLQVEEVRKPEERL